MNDGNNFGGSPLDEIEYKAPEKKNGISQNITAPVLDDIDYVAPTSKKDGPQGVSAPILDDMASYSPDTSKKSGPTGVSVPVLDDADTPYQSSEPEKVIMTDEEIIAGFTPEQLETFNKLPAANQQKVLDLRRSQLGVEAPKPVVTAPVLDEDNYTPPPKKEEPPKPAEPITAPILDDAPEPTKYVPKFVDEDLERAKREGAKKAVSSQLVSDQKDSKESLRMMLQLKEERRAELARKGFKVTIIIALIGVIAAVAFYLLYSGQLGLGYKKDFSGMGKVVEEYSLYIAAIVGVASFLLITGVGGCKSLASFVYLLFGVIQIFPGIVMIPQHKGSMALVGILYGVSLICTVLAFFMLSSSEAVGLYFKKDSD